MDGIILLAMKIAHIELFRKLETVQIAILIVKYVTFLRITALFVLQKVISSHFIFKMGL